MKVLMNAKAISPLVASIILITITITGGLVVFAFYRSESSVASQRVLVEAEHLKLIKSIGTPEIVFSGNFKNAGTKPIKELIIKLHNETEHKVTSVTSSTPLQPGQSVGVTLFPHSTWYVVGNKYTVSIVQAVAVDESVYSATQSVKCEGESPIGPTAGFGKEGTLTFDTGEDSAVCLAVSGDYLYAGLYDPSPGQIVKVSLATFTKVSVLTLDAGEKNIYALTVAGDYLYAGLETIPGKIVKIDLNTFTRVSCLTLDSGENYVEELVATGGYLYGGLATEPAKIVKVNLSTFTKEETLDLGSGENCAYSLTTVADNLYVGLKSDQIAKVSLSSFMEVAVLALGEGGKVYALTSSGDYLYAGLEISPGKIVKIDLSTFTKDATLTLGVGEDNVYALSVIGDYLYAGLGDFTNPGKVVKIELASFTKVETLTFDTGEETVYDLAFSGGYLYAGLWTLPGKIVKIHL